MKKADPKNRKQYLEIISSVVNRPIGQMGRLFKDIPDHFLFDIQSHCKEKSKEQQARYIWWFLKHARPK